MTVRRRPFTDSQKAEIFVRDRAVCAFSGKSLWVLNYGASPLWQPDWIAPARPATRGSASPLDRGVLASELFKSRGKGQRSEGVCFFRGGRPTSDYFFFLGVVPDEIARNLRRFAKLQPADWYFNRCLVNTLLAVEDRWLRRAGREYKRDSRYWAERALRKLEDWREVQKCQPAGSLEARGLAPRQPSPDQQLMLELRDAVSLGDIMAVVRGLAPHYQANSRALQALTLVGNRQAGVNLVEAVEANPLVSPSLRGMIRLSVQRLYP